MHSIKLHLSKFFLASVVLMLTVSAQGQTATLVYNPESLEPGFPFAFDVQYGTRENPIRNLVSAEFEFSYSGFSLTNVTNQAFEITSETWLGVNEGATGYLTVNNAEHSIRISVIRNNGRGVSGYGEMLGGKVKTITNVIEIMPVKTFEKAQLISSSIRTFESNWAEISTVKGTRLISVQVSEEVGQVSGTIRTLDGRVVSTFSNTGLIEVPVAVSGLLMVQIQSEKGIQAGKVLIP